MSLNSKPCTKCSQNPRLSYHSYCKPCHREYQTTKMAAYNKAYFATEEVRERTKQYLRTYKRTPYTYVLTNTLNGTKYYGHTTVDSRWGSHQSNAFNPKIRQYNSPIYRAMREFGIEAFTCTRLQEYSTKQEAWKAEQALIAQARLAGELVYNSPKARK